MFFKHLCTDPESRESAFLPFPTSWGIVMPGSPRKDPNLSLQVAGAQPGSARDLPWEQALYPLPGFPYPCHQWVGNLGHRALGRGPLRESC